MSNYPSFLEYLNSKGKIDKAKVNPKADDVDVPTPKAKEDPHHKNKTPKKHAQVKEYLDFKGKVVEKPDTEEVSDYKGPKEKKIKNTTPKKHAQVKEYIDFKGKVVEKPDTEEVSDYKGPTPAAPEGKGATPYKAANANQNKKEKEEGLGDLGSKDLVYEPDVKNAPKVTQTEQFLNKTKNMSLSEFTQYMIKECGCGAVNDADVPYVTAYTTGKFQPHPPEAIKYVVVLANKNDNILDNIVYEMKNSGSLGKLLKAALSYPEAYDELTSLFGDEKDGPGRCGSFAKSMYGSYSKFLDDQKGLYESVGAPIGFDDAEDEESMDDEGEEDEESMDDMDMESEEDEESMDDMDMEGEEDEEGMDDMDNEEEMGPMDMGDDLEDDQEEPKKLKKKFAHHYLSDAMKKFDPIRKAMGLE